MGRLRGKYHRFSGFPQWSSPVLAWVEYVGSIIFLAAFPNGHPSFGIVGYVGSIIVLVAFPNGHPQFWHGSVVWEVSSL